MTTVRYGSEEFDRLMKEIHAAVEDGGHVFVVFLGSGEDEKQAALAALAEHTGLDVFRRDAAKLVGERPMQTQGSLREAFDNTGDVPTILAFEHADAIFAAGERQRREDDLDEDAMTPAHYLFDRIDHKEGITVLYLTDASHVEAAKEAGAAGVVELG